MPEKKDNILNCFKEKTNCFHVGEINNEIDNSSFAEFFSLRLKNLLN